MCRTDSATLIDLHLKRLGYRTAIREGRIDLIGPPRLTRQFTSWFRTSPFADFIPAEPLARVGDVAGPMMMVRFDHRQNWIWYGTSGSPLSRAPRWRSIH